MTYELLHDAAKGERPIKAWTRGVPVEDKALLQLHNLASLPIVHPHLAVMPDCHWGHGATIGSVVATKAAIVPSAVGVDLGCGMTAARTTLTASDLPSSHLREIREAIERAVPHGRTDDGGRNDRGAWHDVPTGVAHLWSKMEPGYRRICEVAPKIDRGATVTQLGTLGTGNHFIEVCLDEADRVWIMLHSGSRGVGNRIGTYFIARAKEEMGERLGRLPDRDLAWLAEDGPHFVEYVSAVGWAQGYAAVNRQIMLGHVLDALVKTGRLPVFCLDEKIVDCHHNYIAHERHFGEDLWVTRKGAVHAGPGALGIIPGSMGAKSFIVRGKGNADSFHSCSHGAGRIMGRNEAVKRFTLEDHAKATEGVECRKDKDVLDETPAAYKDIDAVMAAQADLVEVVHTLKQVVCVKG